MKDTKIQKTYTELKENIRDIKINQLNYSYEDSIVLKDINLHFTKNEKIILFGESGSGKSTLAKLLSKILEVNDKSIFINNTDINDIDGDWYSKKVVYLSNVPFIMDGDSLRENLTLFDDNKIEAVNHYFSQSYIKEIFNNKDINKSIDNPLDKQELSTGEMQIINIIRLNFFDKDFMILDEAFSNVGEELFENLIRIIHSISQNKILILITHNQQFVDLFMMEENAKVIKIQDGKICDK